MSKLVQLDRHPDPRALRRFGLGACLGLGLLAALAWTERGVFAFGLGPARPLVAAALLAAASAVLLLGWLHPAGNRWLYVGLSLLGFPVAWLISYAIMALLFFGVIAPVGVLLRALGRDPLARGLQREAASYWIPARKPRPTDDYFSQF